MGLSKKTLFCSFLFQNYKENTRVVRAKIIIAFSSVEQLFADTTHLSSCLFS